MKDLIQLVELLPLRKIRQIELVVDGGKANTKVRQLYDLIRKEEVKTDMQAIDLLYQSQSSKTQSAYRKLKTRLTRDLENCLFHLELNQTAFNEYANAKIEIHRCWSKVVLLMGKYARIKGAKLARKGLRLAEKYEITEMTLQFARTLSLHYSHVEPTNNFETYEQKVDLSLELLKHEVQAQRCYNRISRIYSTNKLPSTKQLLTLLDEYVEILGASFAEHNSLTIGWYYYELVTLQATLRKRYQEAYQKAIEGLEYLKKKSFRIRSIEFSLRQNLILASMNLQNYKDARRHLDLNFEILTDLGLPWIGTKNLEFHWAVYCKKYELLPSIVSETLSTKSIRSRPLHLQQWKIKEAYVAFLYHIDWIEKSDNLSIPKFRAGKFINELPTFSKDKKGLNISILVIQLLFLLAKKKYSKVIDRVDALKQYNYRYLREDDMYRASCFIKMLLKIPMHNFHPVAIRRHTKKLEQNLSRNVVHLNQASMEVEIIPYDILWQATLQILRDHKQKSHPVAK